MGERTMDYAGIAREHFRTLLQVLTAPAATAHFAVSKPPAKNDQRYHEALKREFVSSWFDGLSLLALGRRARM